MIDLSKYTKTELISFSKRLDINKTMNDFALNRHLDHKGDNLRFDTFQHMITLFDEGAMPQNIVLMGGMQIGKSIWLTCQALAMAYHGLNILYILPHNTMKDSYVKEKILKPIRSVPFYKEIQKNATSNSMNLLDFGQGSIKFASANVSAELVSYPADVIVIDETDKIDIKSLPNIALAMGRLNNSPHQMTRFVSNPTDEGGFIWEEYAKSDKRVFQCICDNCGQFSDLDWFKTVVKEIEDDDGVIVARKLRDEEWFAGCNRDILIKCPRCESGNLDRFSGKCHWEATANSELGIVGYHMPSLVSPAAKVEKLWQEYLQAIDSPSKLAAFYASRLGLPFSESGHKVSQSVLKGCTKENDDPAKNINFILDTSETGSGKIAYTRYSLIAENNIREIDDKPLLECVMGIDVSPTHLDVAIGLMDGKKIELIYVGKIDPNEDKELYRLIERYNVQVAVIDIGPEGLFAKNFQEEADCTVWRCKYRGAGDSRELHYNFSDMILSVDRTEALDDSYSKLKMRKVRIPLNYTKAIEGVWVDEMQALSRTPIEDKKGKVKMVWTGSNNDHSRHALSYMHLAQDSIEEVLDGESSIFIG